MRNRLAAVMGALLLFAAFPKSSNAQGVSGALSGIVRDSASHVPVAGAVVTVLQSTGTFGAQQLTNERGEYRVTLDGLSAKLKIVRIGFEPREIALAGRTVGESRLDVSLLALISMLRGVRIVANSHCPNRADAESSLSLWEQARAGLLSTVVARQQNPASIVRLISEQTMDGNSDRAELSRVRIDSSVDTVSFAAARSARDFVRRGFQHDSANRRFFFGPDALVLLSDDFATAYCFQLAGSNAARPNQAGIHFAPAVRQSDRRDIDGTLWVDTVARELRDVQFRFLGLPANEEAFRPGGEVSFHSMKNGVVLVDRWSIRSMNSEWLQSYTMQGKVWEPTSQVRYFARVLGGELARAAWPDGFEWHAPLGSFRAHVVTSGGRPATDTRITFVGTPYMGIVDSLGAVVIHDLVPGPYEVQEFDPRVDSLNMGFATKLKFTASRDSTKVATLTVPTLESLVSGRCAAQHQATGDSVFVFGRVLDRDGKPVGDAHVTFASRRGGGVRAHQESMNTAADGAFESCVGWKMDDEILVHVSHAGFSDRDVLGKFSSRVGIVRVNILP